MRIINVFVSISDKLKSGLLGGISLFLIVFMVSAISLSSGILAETRETDIDHYTSPDGIGIMAHTATATLEPEWSPADTSIDYTAEICVDCGSDPVDEVRIYRHMNDESTYTNFVCEAKEGWSLTYFEIGDRKESCLYVAQEENYYIEGNSCETFEFSATTPELTQDLCDLKWRLETRDTVDQWKEQTVYTSVDDVAPEVEKEIRGDYYHNCPPGEGEECWIRQYPNSNISIEVKDYGITGCDASGLDFCEITYRLDEGGPEQIIYKELEGAETWQHTIGFEQDSRHELNITCQDIAGNRMEDIQNYRVDNTAPETQKSFEGPLHEEDGAKWINGITEIHLDATDPDPTGEGCNVGVENIWYHNQIHEMEVGTQATTPPGPLDYCHKPEIYCNAGHLDAPGANDWVSYEGPFTKEGESCHVLQYYSEDKLGNQEDIQYNCFFVDQTAPELDKEVGEPKMSFCEESSTEHFDVTDFEHETDDLSYEFDMSKHVDCENEKVIWTLNYDEETVQGITHTAFQVLVSQNQDEPDFNLGVSSESTPMYKEYDGGWGTATDELPCGMEVVGEIGDTYFQIGVPFDYLENEWYWAVNVEADFSGTSGSSQYHYPYGWIRWTAENTEQGSFFDWTVTPQTDINFTCIDPEPHPSGNEELCFQVWYEGETDLTEEYCGKYEGVEENGWCCVTEMENQGFVFNFDDERFSMHTLDYFCRDAVNKSTDVYRQNYKVEPPVTPPSTTKEYLGPYHYEDGMEWIDTESRVQLSVGDNSDRYKTYYRYETVDDSNCEGEQAETCVAANNCNNNNGWNTYHQPFHIPDESCHRIEYFSVDEKWGAEEDVNVQYVFVDKTPPLINKMYGVPYFMEVNCGDNSACTNNFIYNGIERIVPSPGSIQTVSSCDNGEEKQGFVEGDSVYIKGTNFNPGNYSWSVTGLPGKASCHPGDVIADGIFEVTETGDFCIDVNIVDGEDCGVYKVNFGGKMSNYHIVDSPPPANDNDDCYNGVCSEWISSETPIWLEAFDPEPHPSGVRDLTYRVTMVDDEYCHHEEGWYCEDASGEGEWYDYTEPFFIEDESCHLIEVRATDNVNKSSIHRQCVFVNNEPPVPVKEVGEPKSACDVEDECSWIITKDTPINISCEYTSEHPVGGEMVNWRIWWDGDEEWTEWYSAEESVEFYLDSDCDHKIQYYCSDLLGHTSEVETQNYKVEGSSFEIHLNSKWNLISVPFVLFDDSIDATFGDIEDDIISIWTYCGVEDEWYVYSPEGNEMSNTLQTIHPGWGYWLKADRDTSAMVAGSLFSPAKMPPTKEVASGWNLIGYYGTNDQSYYTGPEGNGRDSYCSLYSLVDTMIGNPRWSSLVTYGQYDGNPTADWKYLNIGDNMDPGAGYWIEMDVDDTYSFSTVCGWNGPGE